MSKLEEQLAKSAKMACPICRKPAQDPHKPFCSSLCRDKDLISWLDEKYVVQGKNILDDEEGA